MYIQNVLFMGYSVESIVFPVLADDFDRCIQGKKKAWKEGEIDKNGVLPFFTATRHSSLSIFA